MPSTRIGANGIEMVPLLQVNDLHTSIFTRKGEVKAVNGVSFKLTADQTLAIVGESGSGKSMTALSILSLLPKPNGRITHGQVLLEGRDVLALSEAEMLEVRGNKISMIFQEPMTSLNPVHAIGTQVEEALRAHRIVNKRDARERVIELIELVGIPDASRMVDEFPHRLSGGMRQRVMIAIALACEPKVLLADEPTTALDVTTQAQVLALIDRLRHKLNMGVILITHDLGVVAEVAQRVVVMYAGYKVEEAHVGAIFSRPLHPYTQGLLKATSRPDFVPGHRKRRLQEIEGVVPSLLQLPRGCPFAPRCPKVMSICRESVPRSISRSDGREVACYAVEAEAAPA